MPALGAPMTGTARDLYRDGLTAAVTSRAKA
jgi:hypothetical protein